MRRGELSSSFGVLGLDLDFDCEGNGAAIFTFQLSTVPALGRANTAAPDVILDACVLVGSISPFINRVTQRSSVLSISSFMRQSLRLVG